MTFKPIFKNLSKDLNKFETSVLLPIRQDKRMFNFLKGISKQKYSDFVLLIANDSNEPYLKLEDFPKNLNFIFYHTPNERYSTFQKLNFLASVVKTPISAITESDCVPSENWLSDLVPIAKKEKSLIKGCEIRPLGWGSANLVFQSEILKKVGYDLGADLFGDYEFGYNVQRHGYPVKYTGFKGAVIHDLTQNKPAFHRIIPSAKADLYVSLKHRDQNLLKRKILRNFYISFNYLAQALVIFALLPKYYFKVRKKNKLEKKKER
ncbi:glycosyltransferase family 2 protein [Candidatus Pacearchaeota archaeon]|nr:glycosyltransferase family 2 protein [Candidatus Pacearchaeota archaeon]